MTDLVLVPAFLFCVVVAAGFHVAAAVGDLTGSITAALVICVVTLLVAIGAAVHAIWEAL